MELTLL
jgi:hypothetical protein